LDFEFWSRAAQALAPRVGICLDFGAWNLEIKLTVDYLNGVARGPRTGIMLK